MEQQDARETNSSQCCVVHILPVFFTSRIYNLFLEIRICMLFFTLCTLVTRLTRKLIVLSYILTFLPCEWIFCFSGASFVLLAGILELLSLNHAAAFYVASVSVKGNNKRYFRLLLSCEFYRLVFIKRGTLKITSPVLMRMFMTLFNSDWKFLYFRPVKLSNIRKQTTT